MLNIERIINRLPLYMQAYRDNSLIHRFIGSFGKEISTFEDNLSDLMRSKWFHHADLDALERMGALFGVPRLPGERREPYRKRFFLTVKELLTGAGTVESISNIVEATIGQPPDIEENPPEFIESPSRELKPDDTWFEFNKSVRSVRPTIIIKPNDNVRNPSITNMDTEETLTFVGMLRKGSLLRINPDGKALLGGIDVTHKMEYLISEEKQDEVAPPKISKMQSQWKYTDATGFFNFGTFSNSVFAPEKRNVISIQMKWVQFKPASFDVRIPLYSKKGRGKGSVGYEKNLRQEVRQLVDHVKSAGVMANINFYDHFTEKNKSRDLGFEIVFGVEYQRDASQKVELGMEIEATHTEKQKCGDLLHSCGVFDITTFDSPNGWG